MKEYEMFPIVKDYFDGLGYKVNAEVKECDITAVKDDKLVIIEMKTSLNITVVYQALERKKVTPYVYVAVPKPKKNFNKSISKMQDLMSKLQVGLLIIDVVNCACVSYVEPSIDGTQRTNNKKKSKIIKEINTRQFDENIGGVNKTKILTAYKELGISLCVVLDIEGVTNVKTLRDKYGFEKNATQYLYTNFYRWYEKVGVGTYKLSKQGQKVLVSDEYVNAVKYFRNKYSEEKYNEEKS